MPNILICLQLFILMTTLALASEIALLPATCNPAAIQPALADEHKAAQLQQPQPNNRSWCWAMCKRRGLLVPSLPTGHACQLASHTQLLSCGLPGPLGAWRLSRAHLACIVHGKILNLVMCTNIDVASQDVQASLMYRTQASDHQPYHRLPVPSYGTIHPLAPSSTDSQMPVKQPREQYSKTRLPCSLQLPASGTNPVTG